MEATAVANFYAWRGYIFLITTEGLFADSKIRGRTLQIEPRAGDGRALHLLAYRDVSELRWVATVLRQALRCPCDSRDSPAYGLVVQSPMLVLRRGGLSN